jgi:hypothetical protein
MTLKPYDAARWDELALRLVDVACEVRQLARACREAPNAAPAVHDKKALEWLVNLERWAGECRTRLEIAQLRQRGARQAESFTSRKRAK